MRTNWSKIWDRARNQVWDKARYNSGGIWCERIWTAPSDQIWLRIWEELYEN